MRIFNLVLISRRCAGSIAFLCAGAGLSLFFLALSKEQQFALPSALGSLALGLLAFLLNKRTLMYFFMGCSAIISHQHLEHQACHQKRQLEARTPRESVPAPDLAPFDHDYLSQR